MTSQVANIENPITGDVIRNTACFLTWYFLKQNDLVHGRFSVSKSRLFVWKQGVDYWFDTIVDQSFENLVRDAEQRDGTVAFWVLYRC